MLTQHAIRIALQTLRMPAPMAGVMGQSTAQARAILQRLAPNLLCKFDAENHMMAALHLRRGGR